MEVTGRRSRQIVVVIPCSDDKLQVPAPARDLYTGRQFVRSLQAAEAGSFGDEPLVLVLSALHGKGSVAPEVVTAQALELIDADADVYAMLPRAYYECLDAALRPLDLYPADCFEACQGGVGEQRQMQRCAVQFGGRADHLAVA